MDHRPEPEERAWLEDSLAALVANEGAEPFWSAPLLAGTDEYLPGGWTVDPSGVQRLARALLLQVGIDKDVRVDLDEPAPGGVAFLALRERECRFAVEPIELAGLAENDLLVPQVAREVARAWRHDRELAGPDAATEEALLDVTCVYLGFGLYTVNAAYNYRASGEQLGGLAITRWSHSSLGALTPQAATYLLALHVVARESDSRRRDAIAAMLEANQETYFLSDCAAIERDRSPLDRMGLSSPRERFPIRGVRLADDAILATLCAPRVPGDNPRNSGAPVFLFPKRHATATGTLSVLLGMVAITVAAISNPWIGAALAAVSGTIRFAFPRHVTTWHCAAIGCAVQLGDNDPICTGCGGVVSGKIKNRNHRLDAEEALEHSPNLKQPPYR